MILNKWIKCVNTGSVDDIINLYTNESSLISTFDGIFIENLSGIKNYFQLLRNKNTTAIVITNNVMKIGNDYLEFGIYEFNQNNHIVRARFTMVSNERGILHHHSSQDPHLF